MVSGSHEAYTADVFDFMDQCRTHDVVILDPQPSPKANRQDMQPSKPTPV
ncbi:MAG: hypothetical protein U0T74_12835 [Chitinophagales bacterium]